MPNDETTAKIAQGTMLDQNIEPNKLGDTKTIITPYAKKVMNSTLPKVIEYLKNNKEGIPKDFLSSKKVATFFVWPSYHLLENVNNVGKTKEDKRKYRDYAKYYTSDFFPFQEIDGEQYRLCSQWSYTGTDTRMNRLIHWNEMVEKDQIGVLLKEINEMELKEKKGKAQDSPETSDPSDENNKSLSRQIIYFGAPGTGKSYLLKKEADENFGENIERVTFYPGYSYQQFVGTYKPHMNGEKIEYKFVPGPLMRTLVKALKAKEPENEKYLLIVEELNRAEAAAVFGDLFQLLDRDEEGKSDYPVAVSEDLKEYLQNEGLPGDSLVFPSNFYIWTTMNSADQGVFPLDTAFKRRWEFEYIGIKDKVDGEDPQWNKFRVEINKKMLEAGINEDKLMGPFFLKKSEQKNFKDSFCGKVLLYLFEDAMRLKRKSFFAEPYWKSYSQLRKAFIAGESVFCDLPDLKLSKPGKTNPEATSPDQTAPEKNEQPVVPKENTNSDSQQS